MNKVKLFKAGSISFIILGLLHLNAHFSMSAGEEGRQLMLDMQAFKIQLFGEHDLLKFHHGFSIMMSFLMIAFGLQNLLSAKSMVQNKGALLSSILISGISLIIAYLYFHILAYGVIFFSLLCFTLCAFMSEEKASQIKRAV